MKRKKFLIFLFLVVSCINENKEIKVGKEENMSETTKISKEYMTLKDFNKKYSYWDESNSKIQSKNKILVKYLYEKEKKLKRISEFHSEGLEENIYDIFRDFSNEKEKIIQILKLIIEAEKDEKFTYFIQNIFIKELKYGENGILKEFNEMKNKEEILLPLLEKNFTENEIRLFFDMYYKNIEFDNYDISGKYGLKKVDKIISEIEKINELTEEERWENETAHGTPLFQNVYDEFSMIYILKNNTVIVTESNKTVKKEIKIKDHKKVDIVIYKGILYIYDDDKIYEYSLKNLNDMKIIDVKELEL